MPDWGIFTDEGCLDHGFSRQDDAERHHWKWYAEDDAVVARCCDQHPEQPYASCEDCATEEDA